MVDLGRKVNLMANKKTKRKKSVPRKSTTIKKGKTKVAIKSKPPKKKKAAAKPKPKPAPRKSRGRANSVELVPYEQSGLGVRSGGQSGDMQGITAGPNVDSESVQELLEEGQSFEAEVVDGVENAADPDKSEVRTREVEEDDVPEEYRDKD